MSIGCPVGHPSGPGKHCPLCGRAYVAIQPAVVVPAPRHAREEVVEPWVRDDTPRVAVEAFAMLSSLASEDS